MRILVTNDDGIACPGLHVLARALIGAGHDVVVVAPAHDCSGFGAAVGPLHLTGTVDFDRVALDGVRAEAFAVDGPPALAVMAAVLGGFGPPPEIVVSGINAGANTGRAVLHSGTVGAALTGLNLGRPGLAVSQTAGETPQWATAAQLAVGLAGHVARLRRPVVVNLNVPNVALAEVRGLVVAALDPGGKVQATMVEREKGVLELHMHDRHPPGAGTDSALLEAGWATITAVVGPQSVGVDLAGICRLVEHDIAAAVGRRIPA